MSFYGVVGAGFLEERLPILYGEAESSKEDIGEEQKQCELLRA